MIEATSSTEISERSTYDDNKDIIWPTIVGIFVTLALGWMICRYKCSSKERSPHVVQCCPKSLCKRIRFCCRRVFRLTNESSGRHSATDSRIRMNSKERLSNISISESSFIRNNSGSSVILPYQQWPTSFFSSNNQRPSFPLTTTTIQSCVPSLQPKRHPLRRESLGPTLENNEERRDSAPWPFVTANMDFHKQTKGTNKNCLLFST